MLAREVQNVQNPALGATLVWRFCCGYVEAHRVDASPPLPLLFFVLPIILHQATSEFVKRTYKSSGLTQRLLDHLILCTVQTETGKFLNAQIRNGSANLQTGRRRDRAKRIVRNH